MDSYPESRDYLLDIAQRISPQKIDRDALRKKYGNIFRTVYVSEKYNANPYEYGD